MRLVGRQKLSDFTKKHADARRWIQNWILDVEEAQWKTPRDITDRYSTADVLPYGKGVIFDVKGNAYRMHVQVSFSTGVVLVERVGTHSEYLRWTY